MLAELSVTIEGYKNDLILLQEERDNYVLANEDNIPESIYNKKLAEYDERIADVKDSIAYWQKEYDEVLDKHF